MNCSLLKLAGSRLGFIIFVIKFGLAFGLRIRKRLLVENGQPCRLPVPAVEFALALKHA